MNIHTNARTCPRSRITLVQRLNQRGSAIEVASAFGVSPRTVYKWRARYRAGGEQALRDASSRPHRMPSQTDAERAELICRLRRCRLNGPQIAQALRMPRSTVAAVLERAGLARLRDLEPAPPPVRYERSRPGDLLHLDIKKLGRIERVGHRITGDRRHSTRGAGWEYVHVAIDDRSRLAYAEVLPSERAETTAAFLLRALAFYLRHRITVREILTDNGPGYRSHAFATICQRFRIRDLWTRPYTPRTNGKAERFAKTLLHEWAYLIPYPSSKRRAVALPRFLRYYNQQRPHAALNRQTPLHALVNNVPGTHT